MKLKTKKTIIAVSGLILCAFAVFTFIYAPLPKLQYGILIGAFVAHIVLNLIWLRCPYCSKYIRRLDQNYCAYCGRELDDEEIY